MDFNKQAQTMETSFIIFLIVIPFMMFFTGFWIGRTFRPLEHTFLGANLIVKYRLAFCIFSGLIMSLFFTFLYYAKSGIFSISSIISFIVLFFLFTGPYYYGMKKGWGKASTEAPSNGINAIPITQPPNQAEFPENITIENGFEAIKITVRTQKRWVFFASEAFGLIFISLCGFPILGIMVYSLLQKYIPDYLRFLIWLAIGGLLLYLLYKKFMETIEFIFDKEIIVITNQRIRVENYGWKFRNRREYLAENIKKITLMFTLAGTHPVLMRSAFPNKNFPSLMIWHEHGLKRFRTIGRGIDPADAQRMLDIIFIKFPQYRG